MNAAASYRWVLATSNPGKLAELCALLRAAEPNMELVPLSAFDIASPAETGETFVENALLKARHASRLTGLPAIADDSGLVVDALDGAPGVHSARYAGRDSTDLANRTKLLEALEMTPSDGRGATFHCAVVALLRAQDAAPLIAFGEWRGEIAIAPSGTEGFGYDPVFFDRSLGQTAAELDPARKNEVSHRGKAIRALVGRWQAHFDGATL